MPQPTAPRGQAPRNKPKGSGTQRMRLVALWLLCALQAGVIFALLMIAAVPERYDLAAGDVSPRTLYATRRIDDVITTAARQQQARNAEPDVYTLDAQIAQQVQAHIELAFTGARNASVYAANWRQQNTPPASEANPQPQPAAYTQEFWQEFYHQLNQTYWQDNPDIAAYLCELPSATITQLQAAVGEQIGQELGNGVQQGHETEVYDRLWTELSRRGFSSESCRLASLIVQQHLQPNYVYSEAETIAAKNRAEELVEPVVYSVGQTIVKEGDVLTHAQVDMLGRLGLLADQTSNDLPLIAGFVLLVGVLALLAAFYIRLYEPQMLRRFSECLMLCLVVTLSVLICFALSRIGQGSQPLALAGPCIAALLIACLLHTRLALVYSVLLSFACGLIATGSQGLFSREMIEFFFVGITASFTGVYLLNRQVRRQQVVLSGFGMAAAAAFAYLVLGLLTSASLLDVLYNALPAALSGMLSAVFVLGTLSLWENIFDVLTPMKLMDLSNPDRPLLRRMITRAPGTYSHSIAVANLAEQACDAIGANGLLVRIGAYYHDIGKLSRPMFFVENQMGRENPHDRLMPQISSQVIRQHVTDGVALARKHKLPRVIQDLIQQHHGDSLTGYFYSAALRDAEQTGQPVDKDLYRYAGPKPQTREAAVLMLADSVEAATRAMKKATQEEMESRVRSVIRQKMDENQLDDCSLTLREIEKITQVFTDTLRGQYHERIEYPAEAQPHAAAQPEQPEQPEQPAQPAQPEQTEQPGTPA